ncbi:MAG: beta-aspartyl-peptidase [Planctomycetes bacterium]|nr:beta-aspartyl-peptidase [Planctomycetota bacterium]
MFELLRNVLVHGPKLLGKRDVLVAAGRVLAIDVELAAPPKLAVRVRDFAGRRLIPGLIEGHAHVTGGGGEAGFKTRVPPVEPSRFTRAGVTAVVGLLGTDDCARTTEELVAATYALRECGLNAWCYSGGYHFPPTTLTGSVRKDVALIDPILGVGELALSDRRSSQPTFDELLRVASDAYVGGLMSGKAGVTHLHLGDGERGLELVRRALDECELPPAIWFPTHVNRRKALFEEACALTDRGVTIDVTAFPVEEGEDAWSAARALERYLAAGRHPERITTSSDSGGCLPVFDADGRVARMDVGSPRELARTLKELVDRGLPLERALPPFTSNVARVLRLAGHGVIEVGAPANFVVLDESAEVSDVMCAGRWHLIDGESVVRGPFESPHEPGVSR